MMLFPNLSTARAEMSAYEPFTTHARGWTSIGWSGPAGSGGRGVIHVCTVFDAEISQRTEGGEFAFDVIDEHSTLIWFRDRASFRRAWAMARTVCNRGGKFHGVPTGEEVDVDNPYDHSAPTVSVCVSAHHQWCA